MKYKCQFPDCEEEVEIGFLLTSHPGELIYELECKGWYAIIRIMKAVITETQIKWLGGMMVGGGDIREALLNSIPNKEGLNSDETRQLEIMRSFMAEAWAMGISKEEFLKWAMEN